MEGGMNMIMISVWSVTIRTIVSNLYNHLYLVPCKDKLNGVGQYFNIIVTLQY